MGTSLGSVPPNMIDQAEELKGWSDDRLIQELQNHLSISCS